MPSKAMPAAGNQNTEAAQGQQKNLPDGGAAAGTGPTAVAATPLSGAPGQQQQQQVASGAAFVQPAMTAAAAAAAGPVQPLYYVVPQPGVGPTSGGAGQMQQIYQSPALPQTQQQAVDLTAAQAQGSAAAAAGQTNLVGQAAGQAVINGQQMAAPMMAMGAPGAAPSSYPAAAGFAATPGYGAMGALPGTTPAAGQQQAAAYPAAAFPMFNPSAAAAGFAPTAQPPFFQPTAPQQATAAQFVNPTDPSAQVQVQAQANGVVTTPYGQYLPGPYPGQFSAMGNGGAVGAAMAPYAPYSQVNASTMPTMPTSNGFSAGGYPNSYPNGFGAAKGYNLNGAVNGAAPAAAASVAYVPMIVQHGAGGVGSGGGLVIPIGTHADINGGTDGDLDGGAGGLDGNGKKRKRKKKERAEGMPRRPLTAYNMYFRDEKNRIFAAIDKGVDPEDLVQDPHASLVGLVEKAEKDDKKQVKEEDAKKKKKKKGSEDKSADSTKADKSGSKSPKKADSPKKGDSCDASKEGKGSAGDSNDTEEERQPDVTKEEEDDEKDENKNDDEKKDDDKKDADKKDVDEKDEDKKGGVAKSKEELPSCLKSDAFMKSRVPGSRRMRAVPHGKIAFAKLAKIVGARWKALDDETVGEYNKLAKGDMKRYQDEMKEYKMKNPQHV